MLQILDMTTFGKRSLIQMFTQRKHIINDTRIVKQLNLFDDLSEQ